MIGMISNLAGRQVAFSPEWVPDWGFLLAFTLAINGMVWKDTIIDGVAAEYTKKKPDIGAEVQAWQQFSLMMVAIFVSSLSGFILDYLGLKATYFLAAAVSLSATLTVLLLDERRAPPGRRGPSLRRCGTRLTQISTPLRTRVVQRLLLYWAISSFNFDLTTGMVYWYDDVAHYSKTFQGLVSPGASGLSSPGR